MKKSKFDAAILKYMLIYILFLNWLLSSSILKNLSNLTIVILITISFFSNGKVAFIMTKLDFICLCLILLLILSNIMLYGISYSALFNLFFFFTSLLCIIFIINIFIKNSSTFSFLTTKKWVLGLNVYFWINIIVIFIQSRIPGFLMLGYAPIYDNLTGFFGPGSTHSITMFCIILTCINLGIVHKKTYKKNIKNIYIFLTIIFMLMTVSINDNTAFLALFPTGVCLYVVSKQKISLQKVMRMFCILILSVFLMSLLYRLNTQLNQFINDRVGYKIQAYFYMNNNGVTKTGWGDERIRALEFAMEYGNAKILGKGFKCNLDDVSQLENYNMYGRKLKVYVGMSDISGISYLGGIWLYLLYCILIANQISKLFSKDKDGLLKSRLAICIFFIIIFTIYTTLMRSISMAILLSVYCIQIADKESGCMQINE